MLKRGKPHPGCLGYMGDYNPHLYGGLLINHDKYDKDPYALPEPTILLMATRNPAFTS